MVSTLCTLHWLLNASFSRTSKGASAGYALQTCDSHGNWDCTADSCKCPEQMNESHRIRGVHQDTPSGVSWCVLGYRGALSCLMNVHTGHPQLDLVVQIFHEGVALPWLQVPTAQLQRFWCWGSTFLKCFRYVSPCDYPLHPSVS